jgi:hypothetical protein
MPVNQLSLDMSDPQAKGSEGLTETLLYDITERMLGIPGCPRHKGVLKGIALRFVELCRSGHDRGGRFYSPDEQAKWLSSEVALCERWPGERGIVGIFQRKFPPPPLSGTAEPLPSEKPQICDLCDGNWVISEDNGSIEWCSCKPAQQAMKENPEWLDMYRRLARPSSSWKPAKRSSLHFVGNRAVYGPRKVRRRAS